MYAAVIVETRTFPNMREIIEGHMNKLPKGWDLVVFHGETNQNKIREAAEGFKNVCFVNMKVHAISIREYNQLLTSESFWYKLTQYERVLIFQTDSMLLRKGIEEFLSWDYVGAPWEWQWHGGNGGLSIRNPITMRAVIVAKKYNGGNEDTYFSNTLNDNPHLGKLAPREVCEKFSVETIFKLGTLGMHAASRWMTKEQFTQIKTQYNDKNVTTEVR